MALRTPGILVCQRVFGCIWLLGVLIRNSLLDPNFTNAPYPMSYGYWPVCRQYGTFDPVPRNFRIAGDTPRTAIRRCLSYHRIVTFESAIRELFVRIPDLEPLYRKQFSYLADEELPYVVFGSFLIPVMETALESQDVERVRAICAYLEQAAMDANADAGLEQLLSVEIGEWLSGTQWEAEIATCLGEQTKRICRYVPGLATQRTMLREERDSHSSLKQLLDRFRE